MTKPFGDDDAVHVTEVGQRRDVAAMEVKEADPLKRRATGNQVWEHVLLQSQDTSLTVINKGSN